MVVLIDLKMQIYNRYTPGMMILWAVVLNQDHEKGDKNPDTVKADWWKLVLLS